MADGQVHEKYILYATAATLVGSVLLYDVIKLEYLIAANMGMLSNVFISPDIDQDGVVLVELRTAQLLTFFVPRGNFKNILVDKFIKLIKIFLAPYSLWWKHRHYLTHTPLIGTLIRWYYIYLATWYIFLRPWLTLHELNVIVFQDFQLVTVVFLTFVSIGDFIHAALDKFEFIW